MRPLIMVIGTRPDAIKMLPLYKALKARTIPVILCSTSQHNELLTQVLEIFGVQPDFNLDIMKHDQTLAYITAEALTKISTVLKTIAPLAVIVQGDTATAYAAALAAFYEKIPVLHVEAGLRTSTIQEPFPEELYRRSIGLLASYHFAPTPQACAYLQGEGIAQNKILCTGNTIIDALSWIVQQIKESPALISEAINNLITKATHERLKIVVCTLHRRESQQGSIHSVLTTMVTMLNRYEDVLLVFPAHPNPKVQQAIHESGIHNHPRCIVMKALNYPNFITLLQHASWIMTDSGGIQEEAIALKKPVIVLRNETERYEGVLEGFTMLVAYDSEKILLAVARCYAMKLKEMISLPSASPTEQIASFIEHEYILQFQSKSYNSFVQGAL